MEQPANNNTFWPGIAVGLLVVVSILVLMDVLPSDRIDSEAEEAAEIIDPYAADEVVPLVDSPTPAIHVSMWWDEQIALRDLHLVQDMGFYWIKQKFSWRDIQPYPDSGYDWYHSDVIVNRAEEYGLSLLVRLDRQPFWTQTDGGDLPLENAPPADLDVWGDFCYAVADRYQGRIRAYQVWNEPNLAREWGEQPPDPAAYTELLATCYEGIKRGDPDAIVISAGLAPTGSGFPVAMPHDEFLQGMYDAGAAQYYDMLGYNAPGYAAPPYMNPGDVAANEALGGHDWNAFRHVEAVRRLMVENGDATKQIAILEMGWTTDPIHPEYSWFAVSEEQQAEYLAGAYWWARQNWQPWIGFMTTIYIADPYWTEDDEQYWWSVSYPDWPHTRLRPAYYALQGLPNWGGPDSPYLPTLVPTVQQDVTESED